MGVWFCGLVDGWVLSFDILIFDCLLKAPQPVTGLFLFVDVFYAELTGDW